MGPKKASNTTKRNKRNSVICQYTPPPPSRSPQGQEGKKSVPTVSLLGSQGSWTYDKELVLLQKYARIFPPTCPRGSMSSEWQKGINTVNAVAPNDKPLQYDACWRKVHFNENKETYLSGINQYRSPIEKAAIQELEYDVMKARKKDFIQKKEVVKNELERLMQTRSSAGWEHRKQLNREERDEPMNMVTHNRGATIESKDSIMEDSTGTVSDDEHEAIYDMYIDKQTQFWQKMLESLSSQKEYQEKML
ncbi:hypothetical protein J3Q64DRAFT_1833759 [Phycomyces blakesleeanus]|uniref:Uncharacterized protein n=2 Tax=Phycomyces blakesleeanus TaxID=4837 RepID=A0A163A438_PHYB8|nr:hypothetical protein PHYBLDRAFT_63990 [Phycomyces blakesleeanus NRRL 1555(-)]OAD70941.1 hypothetical protein PHYBLDRAFT_63990 [Phycomyces blakesleeanus NRRL 1555(-)]|eukprot:XP_018288981.1 hypothetical protein PHYBLDRAFT_63990 [Phycomyces blakesleeanus NRRL 1555(-)]